MYIYIYTCYIIYIYILWVQVLPEKGWILRAWPSTLGLWNTETEKKSIRTMYMKTINKLGFNEIYIDIHDLTSQLLGNQAWQTGKSPIYRYLSGNSSINGDFNCHL